MATKRTMIQAGDVFDIATPSGFAQFQALFFERQWGSWIRVFAGVSDAPSEEVVELTRRTTRFCVFFPAQQALAKGLIRRVGHVALAHGDSVRPRMKAAGGVARSGKVLDWFIVDGASHRRTKTLTDAERCLPEEVVVNDTALVEMIADGWSHETRVLRSEQCGP
jgi:hypothetical protein